MHRVCLFAASLVAFGCVAEAQACQLIAYYPFCGNANDASGKGNHAIVQGATLTADMNGQPNAAYFFDSAQHQMIYASHRAVQNQPLNRGLTISLWVNVRQYPSLPGMSLVGKQPSGACAAVDSATSSNHGGLFDLMLADGRMYFSSQFESFCATEGQTAAMDPLPVNVWKHLAVTVNVSAANRAKEVVRYFVDGREVDRRLFDTYPETRILSQPSQQPIRIGERRDARFATGVAWFDGAMDEIRIYDGPLSPERIQALYVLGSRSCAAP